MRSPLRSSPFCELLSLRADFMRSYPCWLWSSRSRTFWAKLSPSYRDIKLSSSFSLRACSEISDTMALGPTSEINSDIMSLSMTMPMPWQIPHRPWYVVKIIDAFSTSYTYQFSYGFSPSLIRNAKSSLVMDQGM